MCHGFPCASTAQWTHKNRNKNWRLIARQGTSGTFPVSASTQQKFGLKACPTRCKRLHFVSEVYASGDSNHIGTCTGERGEGFQSIFRKSICSEYLIIGKNSERGNLRSRTHPV
jgi:hypothetical protein